MKVNFEELWDSINVKGSRQVAGYGRYRW